MSSYILGDLLKIKNGRDHKHLEEGNIPVFGSGGLMRHVNQSLYDDESILLPRKGSLSNIQYTKKPFWTVDTLYYTEIDKKKVEPYYLYHYLKRLDLSNLNSGTGVPSMTFGAYYDIKIKLPDLPTQQKIASVLSALDDKIELNNRVNVELEAMAKTLYDYWFVQFDFPVSDTLASTPLSQQSEAGGEKNTIAEHEGVMVSESEKNTVAEHEEIMVTECEKNKVAERKGVMAVESEKNTVAERSRGYKSSGGKMVYNETLKREIPEGWEVKTVGDILDKNRATTKINAKEYLSKGKIPVIDQSINFICGFTNDESSLITTKEKPAIVFGDHTRILKLINFDFARGADGTQILFSKIDKMPQFLLFYSLLKIDLSNYGYARHFKFLKDQNILIPKKEISNEFDEFVKSCYIKIYNNQKQNQELSALRDWLLPMLMNGQVKVE